MVQTHEEYGVALRLEGVQICAEGKGRDGLRGTGHDTVRTPASFIRQQMEDVPASQSRKLQCLESRPEPRAPHLR